MSDYRNVFSLIAAVAIMQLSAGILGIVTPLGLEQLGVSLPMVGFVAAIHAAGFMAGAACAPRALGLFGNIRVFSAAAALTCAGVLMMDLFMDPVGWTAIRLVQGASFALMFASAEAWLSDAVPAKNRGGVTGFYHVCAKAALLTGPFFASGHGALESQAYVWCGLFFALALVPICLTRRGQPAPPDNVPLPFSRLFKLAPAAVVAAFIAGVVNTGTLALLPIYAAGIAPNLATGTEAAAYAGAAAWLGGLISQWPAGRISDRVDRRLVVAIMALVSAAAALLLALTTGRTPLWTSLVLLSIWGAGSLSFYGVAIAHAIDRAASGQMARVMSGLLFVWAAGSVVGPPLSGFAMRAGFGNGGLFALAALMSLVLAILMGFRKLLRDEPPQAAQEPWEMAQPTSIAGADFDPRGEPG